VELCPAGGGTRSASLSKNSNGEISTTPLAPGFVLTFLLVLLGFFPIAVLLGVGAIFIATLWVASQ
jgi:hypothetical protein